MNHHQTNPSSRQKIRDKAEKLVHGFSLLEVMIVVGLMSMVGLAISSIVTNSTKMQKRLEQKDTALNLAGQIRSVIQSAELCKAALCRNGETCESNSDNDLSKVDFPTRATGNETIAPIKISGIQTNRGGAAGTKILGCLEADNCNGDPTKPELGTPVPGTPGLFVNQMMLQDIKMAGKQGTSFDLVLAKLRIFLVHDRKVAQGSASFRPIELEMSIIVDTNTKKMVSCVGSGLGELWKRATDNSENIFYSGQNGNLGLVGIGTDSPSSQLHIQAPGGAAGAAPMVRLVNNSSDAKILFDKGSGNESDRFLLATVFGLNGGFQFAQGSTLANDDLIFSTDKSGVTIGDSTVSVKTIKSRGGALDLESVGGPIRLLNGGAPRLTIDNAGAVNIPGNANITGNTSITGNTNITGTTTIGAAGGTATKLVVNERSNFASKITVQADGADINGPVKFLSGPVDFSGVVNVGTSAEPKNMNVFGQVALRSLATVPGITELTFNSNLKINGNIEGNDTVTSEITKFKVISTGGGSSSDERLKHNIIPLSRQSDLINQITTFSYNYIEDVENTLHYGFVAQDLKRLFPHLVQKDSKGFYYIRMVELIPVAIKGLQESNARIKELEEKVQSLEERISKLESLIQQKSE